MMAVILGVLAGLLAFELWGSIDLVAKLTIRLLTLLLREPWRSTRRAELDALVHPCEGERRLVALLRVVGTCSVLVGWDLVHGRLRLPHTHSASGARAGKRSRRRFRAPDMHFEIAMAFCGSFLILLFVLLCSWLIARTLGVGIWWLTASWLFLAVVVWWGEKLTRRKRAHRLFVVPTLLLITAPVGLLIILSTITSPLRQRGRE